VPFAGEEVPSAWCEIFTLTLEGQCLPGDLDDDGDVDLDDYAAFFQCLTGPDGGPVIFDCLRGDFDGDDDIDLLDFAAFQAVFDGGQ